MIKKMKNILNLTQIFLKDSYQNSYIINKKTNKINKKSIFVWLMIIVMLAVTYLSYEVIDQLVKINQAQIFLNTFFLLVAIIIDFQIILSIINVYFFSQDLELILPLPIKSEEILIAKFNTILINIYFTEFMFMMLPLIVYGILIYAGIAYYICLFIILFIFPILLNLIISIIMMVLMKLTKFIKNKDVFQVIITFIFILVLFLLEFKIGSNIINKVDYNDNIENQEVIQAFENFNGKLENVNKYFLEINPIIDILNNYNKLDVFSNLLKIIIIDLIFFILFIFVGKKYYLKNILNNNKYVLNKIEKNYIEKNFKKRNIEKSYIIKEFKLLLKNPIFFMQCVFPIFILIVSMVIIIIIALPNIQNMLMSNFLGEKIGFSIDLGLICLILGIIQFIFTLSNISISAVSREGKNAIYMKFLPIDFYKQFFYKTIPQITINMILILVILILIKLIFPQLDFIYLFIIFILANLFNILNSKLMLIVDFCRPNLKWNTYYEAIKQNKNKLFQYVFTIISILILVYFNKIFSNINLKISCLLMILILIIIILLINKIIKINIKKLFKNIN